MASRFVLILSLLPAKDERSDIRTREYECVTLTILSGSETVKSLEFGSSPCFSLSLPTEQIQPGWEAFLGDESLSCTHGALARLFLKLFHELAQMDESSLRPIEERLLEMVLAGKSDVGVQPWLEQARNILHSQFAEQPRLSVIASSVGVHPVHLAREFRKHYGSSIGEYLRKLRIEFACHQLLASNDPPVKIAALAGFVDQSHFSRTFKRFLGTTPGRYRAALKANTLIQRRHRGVLPQYRIEK